MAKKPEAKKTNETPAASNGKGGETPSLSVLTQYIKDLSFENPNSPNSLLPQEKQPEIKININVNANPLAETDFEVTLHLEAKAGEGKAMMFNVDLTYAGIFRLVNIPEEAKHAAILIECPRMLFPFARQIISDATRNGGFPPLMIDPVDFARLYQTRMAQAAQSQAEPAKS
jgi:preprotein translocase subunit SecB